MKPRTEYSTVLVGISLAPNTPWPSESRARPAIVAPAGVAASEIGLKHDAR